MLGDSQMLTPFSTQFLARFSQWESIDIFNCENRTENQPQVLTWMRTDPNVYIYVFEEPNRFSHRTQIRFSECSVSFIGSSCSSSHLGLLLFSCCHYFFSHTAITFLPLLFFSLYCYHFFPIALILFLLLLLFSHGVALSMWWIHLIINY
jgi:hypothetical protein